MFIGIDLGGTNIAVGLVSEKGKLIASGSTPTMSERDYTEIVKDMAVLAEKLLKENNIDKSEVKAIGIGSPGTIDSDNGVVVYSNNIRFNMTPLRDEMQKYFNVPVAVENDANAAAYGEYFASGDNASSFLAVTLGTGVGGGIILDKKIYRGFNGAGAEVGHTTLIKDGEQCTCGRKGCWETYASVTALIRQTKEAMAEDPDSLMHEIVKEYGSVSGRTSFDAAKRGDKTALKVVNKYVEYVAEGITNLVNIFQPEIIVVGGGISREGEYLIAPVRKLVEENDYNKLLRRTEIKVAPLFNEAGIIGAAFAAKALIK